MAGLGIPAAEGLLLAFVLHHALWLLLPAPFALLIWTMARVAPRAYRLAVDGLHVERRGAEDLVVPYRAIRGLDRERRSTYGVGAGSKGFLGWFTFGRGWRPSGAYRLALTRRENVVWLETDAGWLALSPDAPEGFVSALRGRLTAAR